MPAGELPDVGPMSVPPSRRKKTGKSAPVKRKQLDHQIEKENGEKKQRRQSQGTRARNDEEGEHASSKTLSVDHDTGEHEASNSESKQYRILGHPVVPRAAHAKEDTPKAKKPLQSSEAWDHLLTKIVLCKDIKKLHAKAEILIETARRLLAKADGSQKLNILLLVTNWQAYKEIVKSTMEATPSEKDPDVNLMVHHVRCFIPAFQAASEMKKGVVAIEDISAMRDLVGEVLTASQRSIDEAHGKSKQTTKQALALYANETCRDALLFLLELVKEREAALEVEDGESSVAGESVDVGSFAQDEEQGEQQTDCADNKSHNEESEKHASP